MNNSTLDCSIKELMTVLFQDASDVPISTSFERKTLHNAFRLNVVLCRTIGELVRLVLF